MNRRRNDKQRTMEQLANSIPHILCNIKWGVIFAAFMILAGQAASIGVTVPSLRNDSRQGLTMSNQILPQPSDILWIETDEQLGLALSHAETCMVSAHADMLGISVFSAAGLLAWGISDHRLSDVLNRVRWQGFRISEIFLDDLSWWVNLTDYEEVPIYTLKREIGQS